jgi:signal transduction histidine kinase
MGDGNRRFVDTNLSESMFDTVGVDLLAFFDTKGQAVAVRFRDSSGKASSTAPLQDVNDTANAQFSGIHYVGGLPLLVCSRPLLRSNEQGPPRGRLIMGRFLTSDRLRAIAKRIGVEFQMQPRGTSLLAHLVENERRQLDDNGFLTREPSERSGVESIGYFTDSAEYRAAVVQVLTPATLLRSGLAAVRQMTFNVGHLLLVITLVAMLLVHVMVSVPLAKLAENLEGIGDDGRGRVGGHMANRKDEIGTVARRFDELLRRLDHTRSRLMQASREAGKAEVARGILHNAGNALNSVSVSVKELELLSSSSKLVGLSRAVALLREHEVDLVDFLTKDPRGIQVVDYLENLALALEHEQQETRSEIAALSRGTAHLVALLHRHQEMASKPIQQSTFALNPIILESVGVVETSFRNHGIAIHLDLDDEALVTGDPVTLQQIVINLLTNAKDALLESGNRSPCVEIVTKTGQGSGVEIRIADNGPGMSPAVLERAFESGFTTKKHGSGLGLHYCATAAQEMGWSIAAESLGPGQGSVFYLRSYDLEHRRGAA